MMMIRRMTGVCPQHDILFDQLSAREHLYFFAAVRGIRRQQIKAEVKRTLRDVDLHETADAIAKNLSGGQKRKLSVGIAIIGDPKVLSRGQFKTIFNIYLPHRLSFSTNRRPASIRIRGAISGPFCSRSNAARSSC